MQLTYRWRATLVIALGPCHEVARREGGGERADEGDSVAMARPHVKGDHFGQEIRSEKQYAILC